MQVRGWVEPVAGKYVEEPRRAVSYWAVVVSGAAALGMLYERRGGHAEEMALLAFAVLAVLVVYTVFREKIWRLAESGMRVEQVGELARLSSLAARITFTA